MDNSIRLLEIEKKDNRVIYSYQLKGAWSEFFIQKKYMEVEYDECIETVPDSVLAIPFVGSILPLVWLQNATIYLNELDKDYYDSLKEVKNGYKNMIPELVFEGDVSVDRTIDNEGERDNCIVMFSGGVDAYTTFFKHINEEPILLTIWGADLKLKNEEGWRNVYSLTQKVAQDFGLKSTYIKSTFREFLDEDKLNDSVRIINDGFWHALQHSIAMLSHVAPFAYLKKVKTIYIASSYPDYMLENEKVICASDPRIDNKVRFCGSIVKHDGTEFDRQGKIEYLVNNAKRDNKPLQLRVCFLNDKGTNCCKCEKCYRTILQLVSEGEDPNNFGFDWNYEMAKTCEKDMKRTLIAGESTIRQSYPLIRKRMIDNKGIIPNYEYYKWFETLNIKNFNNYPIKRVKRSLVYKGFRKILKMLYLKEK